MTSHEKPRTVVRADVLAAKLFTEWSSGSSEDQRLIGAVAAQCFNTAAAFMREAARRNPLTGELLNEGLPADAEDAP